MNTKNLAIASTVGVVALVAMLFAFPAMAASNRAPQSVTPQQLAHQAQYRDLKRIDLKFGQNISIVSVAGGYREVGNPAVNGTASGSMTLRVTGSFVGGYALTTTGGTISVNGTTYTISAGSAELGPFGAHMTGQAASGTSAQLLFSVLNLGKFGSTDYGILRVDLTTGSSQFVARLLVTVSA
ncbi:MAG TPA: hypothetical protein VFE91_04865 [Nitrososphaerales archaeon]|nr:hypothetical protein [Nitrososphaerales archaeon]